MRAGVQATLLIALSLDMGVTFAASKPLLSNGPMRSQAEEDANEATALAWHRNIMGGDKELGLSLMARDFIQHDVEEPSGSLEFVAFFTQPGGPPGTNGSARSPANAAIKAQAEAAKAAGQPLPPTPAAAPRPLTLQTRLASVTDGDITLAMFATRGGDPGRFFGSNMFETKNGKVTQEWYSGPTFTLPEGTQPTQDYSQWYAAPYALVSKANVQFLVPVTAADRKQREANKKLVADFWERFFVRKQAAAGKVLSADLRTHIEGAPNGADFATYAQQNPDKVTAPDTKQLLFLLGDGDLVAIGFPVPLLGDPGAWYAQNLVRVKDGKIVEWWYSGYPTGSPTLRYGASWPIGKGPRPGTTD